MSVVADKYVDAFVQQCERLGVAGESDGRYRLVGCALDCYYSIGIGGNRGACVQRRYVEGIGIAGFVDGVVGNGGLSSSGSLVGAQREASHDDVGGRGTYQGVDTSVEVVTGYRVLEDGGGSSTNSQFVAEGDIAGARTRSSLGDSCTRKVEKPIERDEHGSLSAVAEAQRSPAVSLGGVVDDAAGYVAGVDSRGDFGRQVVDRGRFENGSSVSSRGKNWARNQAKRRRAKVGKSEMMSGQWRKIDGSGGCVSDESVTGTACTVDTRTAVEIQAAQTLAARRVAENDRAVAEARVAKKLAEHRLAALEDTSRTDAVERLAVARMESRINREKLSSQVAYGKIDKSLKSSLGSAGSAGEFALKKQVKLGAEHKIRAKYLQEQIDKMLPLMPGHVRDAIAAMAPPVIPSDEEIFGDCPADWPIHIQEEYYEEQRRHDQELAVECADYRVVIDDGGMDYEKIRRELDACL